MKPRRLLIFAAASGAVLVTAASAQANRGVLYGVNDVQFATDPGRAFALAAPLHLARVAVHLRWVPNRTAGHELDGVPAFQPVTAIVDGPAHETPRAPFVRGDYCRYVRELVDRYPNIREVQIWNEPTPGTWSWSGTTDDYVELLAVCYDALPRTVRVLGPGSHPDRSPQVAFVRAVRNYYIRTRRPTRLIDGYAVHPYWNIADASSGGYVARIMNRLWRNTPQPPPNRGLRFWWTETGSESTTWNDGDYFGRENPWRMIMSPDAQAVRVAAVVLRARCDPLVAAQFNFLLVDERDLGRWQSGLFSAGGIAKPAFYAYLAARTQADTVACR